LYLLIGQRCLNRAAQPAQMKSNQFTNQQALTIFCRQITPRFSSSD